MFLKTIIFICAVLKRVRGVSLFLGLLRYSCLRLCVIYREI